MRDRLSTLNLPDMVVAAYLALYEKYRSDSSKIGDWDSIKSPSSSSLISYDSLPVPQTMHNAFGKLAVCKLNGGLGSSMGCSGAKSMIVVKEGETFLDLIIDQVFKLNKANGVSIPLLFMNSFYTHEETQKVISQHSSGVDIHCFQQNQFPRLLKMDDRPLSEEDFGREAWYPPGHGDIYNCLKHQGILDKLLRDGKEVLFVSNADNLGAVVDGRILSYMLDEKIPFLMEVTKKTAADVKGGTLYYHEGKLHLLEIARVPDEHMDEFCSLAKFNTFNTNNIWINLSCLKKKLEQGPLDLEVIVNNKLVGGVEVVQLETAIGSALDHFPGAKGLLVGRERFLPVKKTDDLLLIQSNLYVLDSGYLIYNPERKGKSLPVVRLGEAFARLEDYFSRFEAIPDMLELNSLKLEGDIYFEKNVTLKGDVSIVASNGRVTIPCGSILENRSIT